MPLCLAPVCWDGLRAGDVDSAYETNTTGEPIFSRPIVTTTDSLDCSTRFAPMKRTPIDLCGRRKNRPVDISLQVNRSRYLQAFATARAMRFWRPRSLGKAIGTAALAAALCIAPSAAQAQFPASFDFNALDGSDGFAINGAAAFDSSGYSVSGAGDVNGDGIDDVIIGATNADPNGNSQAGESYVVFGSNGGFSSSLDLNSLDGTNGFTLNGIDAGDLSGGSVSGAGDVNGDGIDDLIIGARSAIGGGVASYGSGESYVVFGQNTGFASSLNLSTLDGNNGFVVSGIDGDDNSGISVSGAGDINGDGIDDMIIGASRAGTYGSYGDRSFAGESYVVFGQNGGFSSAFDLTTLNGNNGFLIDGQSNYDASGTSVSSAGDVNGDGIDDLIIGAPYGSGSQPDAGQSYVVFGSNSGFSSSLDPTTLNGTNGFSIQGNDLFERSGTSVSSAGDINGDGIDDLIIGTGLGYDQSYVVFGQDNAFNAIFDLGTLDGTNGFVLDGIDGFFASSVSDAGDVNGDGFDDLVIGGGYLGSIGDGGGYVVFGGINGFPSLLDLSTLDGTNGFVLNSETGGINSVSGAGDVNGDGIDDLIFGDPYGRDGTSYVVFGRSNAIPEPGSAALFGAGLLGWFTRRRRR